MAGTRTLKLEVVGDAKSGVKALRETGTAAEQTASRLDVASRRMVDSLGGAERAATLAGGKMRKALTDAVPGGDLFSGAFGAEGASSKAALAGAAVAGSMAVAAAGALKLGEASVKAYTEATNQAEELHRITGMTVEDSSRLANASRSLGVDYRDLMDSVRQFATQIDGGSAKLAEYGLQIKRTSTGAVDYAATIKEVAAAYNAETDPARRAALAAQVFGEEYNKIIPLLLRYGEVSGKLGEQGGIITQADIERAKAFQVETAKLASDWQAIKIGIGSELVPALTDAAVQAERINGGLNPRKVGEGIGGALVLPLRLATAAAKSLGDAVSSTFGDADDAAHRNGDSLRMISGAIRGLAGDWASIPPVLNIVEGAAISAGAALLSATQRSSASFAALISGSTVAIDASGRYAEALDALNAATEAQAAARSDASDKVTAAGRRVLDAEQAQLDASSGITAALVDLDQTRLESAQAVADAEIEISRRLTAAAEALADAQVRAAKDVRAAEQDLADSRADAADQIAAAVNEDNPFKRQRIIEAANRKIADAEANLAETRTGAAVDVADAQRNLAEEQADAEKAKAKAAEDAAARIAAAQKRVVDAQDSARHAADQLSDAMGDAGRAQDIAASATARLAGQNVALRSQFAAAVQATHDYAFSLAVAGASQDEISAAVARTRAELAETARTQGWPTDKLQVFLDLLDQIPRQIPIELGLSLNAYQFRQQLIQASQALSDPASRAMLASGAALGDVGIDIVPRFADGGIFRTPGSPGGAGLAILHDGERVTPAAEVGRGGGVTVQVTVQGSVISAARDLADVIAEATRRGVALAGRP